MHSIPIPEEVEETDTEVEETEESDTEEDDSDTEAPLQITITMFINGQEFVVQ